MKIEMLEKLKKDYLELAFEGKLEKEDIFALMGGINLFYKSTTAKLGKESKTKLLEITQKAIEGQEKYNAFQLEKTEAEKEFYEALNKDIFSGLEVKEDLTQEALFACSQRVIERLVDEPIDLKNQSTRFPSQEVLKAHKDELEEVEKVVSPAFIESIKKTRGEEGVKNVLAYAQGALSKYAESLTDYYAVVGEYVVSFHALIEKAKREEECNAEQEGLNVG